MFYTAKTFSVHRRVRNHYTKRILNLILNRKKFSRQENDTLDKHNRGKTATAANPPRYTFSTNFVNSARGLFTTLSPVCHPNHVSSIVRQGSEHQTDPQTQSYIHFCKQWHSAQGQEHGNAKSCRHGSDSSLSFFSTFIPALSR